MFITNLLPHKDLYSAWKICGIIYVTVVLLMVSGEEGYLENLVYVTLIISKSKVSIRLLWKSWCFPRILFQWVVLQGWIRVDWYLVLLQISRKTLLKIVNKGFRNEVSKDVVVQNQYVLCLLHIYIFHIFFDEWTTCRLQFSIKCSSTYAAKVMKLLIVIISSHV